VADANVGPPMLAMNVYPFYLASLPGTLCLRISPASLFSISRLPVSPTAWRRQVVQVTPLSPRRQRLKGALLKALPNAQEGLAYQMPAYTLNGVGVLYFAGWKFTLLALSRERCVGRAFAKELAHTNAARGRSSSHCPSLCPSA